MDLIRDGCIRIVASRSSVSRHRRKFREHGGLTQGLVRVRYWQLLIRWKKPTRIHKQPLGIVPFASVGPGRLHPLYERVSQHLRHVSTERKACPLGMSRVTE